MKKSFILLLVVSLTFALYGFSCSNSGGGSKAEPREFYIEGYQIKDVWYYCYGILEPTPDQPLDSGGGSAPIGAYYEESEPELQLTIPEEGYEDVKMYILQPGRGYSLVVQYFNDKEDTQRTSWVAFEVIVDGERYSSSGVTIIPSKKTQEGTAQIILFNPVPWQLEGKEVMIDVWVEDETGVQSEVYSFQVAVYSLWYPHL